jgi:hypothetical protein
MRTTLAVALALALASVARAHDVPIDPSDCIFDRLELTVPELDLVADVAPATEADAMRVVYDVATRTAQFTAVETRARPFTIAGHAGALGFPQAFQTDLLKSGDLTFPLVGLALTLDGETRLAPVTLTTAMLAASGTTAEGAPIGADGRVTLVGAIAAGLLPAPLDGVRTLVRASCVLTPAPDLDQFVPVFEPATLRLVMRERGGRLTALLRGGAPELDGRPMHLRVRAGDVQLLLLDLPSGLTAESPRRFVGTLPDGTTVQVRSKLRGVPTYRVVVKLPAETLPPGLSESGPVDVLYELGGVIARDAGTYRMHGTTLQARRRK